MGEFLSGNWPYIIVAIVYVAERAQALSKNWAEKIRKLVAFLHAAKHPQADLDHDILKVGMQELGLYHDPDIDAALDTVDPEFTPRVSKGKRFLNGLLKVLPVVTRFVK